MPSSTWVLAVVELIYFLPSTIPLFYLLWKHRRTGFLGWLLLFIFTTLQILGSALTISAGPDGTPSVTSIIITEVGLSPLMLGLAGIVHEWAGRSGLLKGEPARRGANLITILYHILVAGAVVLYAIGASEAAEQPPEAHGEQLAETGVVLLSLFWAGLCVVFGFLARGIGFCHVRKPLFWALALSLALLGVRLVYQCAATFSHDRAFNPVVGSIALRVIFEFITGALILAAMVTGGVLSIEDEGSRIDTDRLESRDVEIACEGGDR